MRKKALIAATVKDFLGFEIQDMKILQELGYEISVAANSKESTYVIPVSKVREYQICFERNPFSIKNLKAYRQLSGLMEAQQFDLIHCHTPVGGVLGRIAAKKYRKYGTKVVYTAHGFHFYEGAPLKNWLLFYPIEKLLSKWTDVLITINREDYKRAKKYFHAKTTEYVPGIGIDLSKFRSSFNDREVKRKELGVKTDEIMFLSVGELNQNKNHELVIKAIHKLNDPKIKYFIAGKGDLKDYLEQLIRNLDMEEEVRLIGYREDIANLNYAADFFVFPSKREGLSVALMEAIACQTPVICSDIRGNRDLVKDGSFLFRSDDEEMLEKCMKSALKKNKEELAESVERNLKNLLKYDVKKVEKKMRGIYKSLNILEGKDEKLEKMGNNKVHRMLLFIDAIRAVEDSNGEIYFPGEISENTWKRYLDLCEELVVICRKSDVVISTKDAKKNYNVKSQGNIKIFFVKDRFSNIKSYFSLSIKRYNAQLIEKEIENADAVVVRTFSAIPSNLFDRLLKKYHKKVLVESVGCPWDAMWNHGIKGKILAPYSFCSARKKIKNADYVCYVTERFLQGRYPAKGKQVAVSDVDIPDTDIKVLKRRKEKINHHTGKYKIATVGAVYVDYKGQKYVIKALAELKKRGNRNFEYYCVGGGDSRKLRELACRLGVSDCVFFPGALPHDKVLDFLDEMDLYIQPSLLEGLPRALVEAMSRGLPAFGSDVGGIPELLNKKCLFKKKSVKQICGLLESVKKETMLKQAKINFETAKKYEPHRNNRRREAFYREYIEECNKKY